jgi:hypothetical protein
LKSCPAEACGDGPADLNLPTRTRRRYDVHPDRQAPARKALGLAIRQTLRVLAVRDLGPDYSHQVAVSFRLRDGRPRTLYARHRNRLADPAGCNLNDGNPARKVRVAFRNLQALPEQQAE